MFAVLAKLFRNEDGATALEYAFVASLVSAFVLALFFHWLRVSGIHYGLVTSFHVWLGFVATVQFTDALFQKKSMKLFAINTGFQLLCFLVMGAILASWT